MLTFVFISHKFSFNEITILSYNESIEKLCSILQIPFIKIKINNDISYKGLINHREYFKSISAEIKGENILFCFNVFDYWGLYFMYLLKKNNRVYFENKEIIFPFLNLWENIIFKNARRLLLDSIVFKIILGLNFSVFKIPGRSYMLGIKLKTIEKDFLKYKFENDHFENNQKEILKTFNIQNIDVLYVDDGADYYEIEETLLKNLIDFLTEINMNFYIKPHPTSILKSKILSAQNIIPKEIPAEFLSGIPKIVIFVQSCSAIMLSEYLNCISLINLVKWEQVNYKIFVLDEILGEKAKLIKFPTTIKELHENIHEHFNKI